MFMDTPIVIELPYTPMWNRDVAKGDTTLEYYRLSYLSLLVIEFEDRACSRLRNQFHENAMVNERK